MKLSLRIKFIILIDFLFLTIYLVFKNNSPLVEKYYSSQFYPILTKYTGRFSDIFPFSLSEVVLIILVIYLIFIIIKGFILIILKKKRIKNLLIKLLLKLFIIFSIIFIWFYGMWGFNYFRMPLVKEVIKNNKDIDDEYFLKVLTYFINNINSLYQVCPYNNAQMKVLVNQEIHQTIFKLTDKHIYPAKRVKFLFTKYLARINSLGLASPFFLESHISNEIFPWEFPSTLAHEKAHLYGFTNETEANYLAFLSCLSSDSPYHQYSGYIEVLPYFFSEYRKRNNKEDYKKIISSIRPEVLDQLEKQKKRYLSHKSRLTDLAWDIYDLYLKANNIKEGNIAYSRVVLMILSNEEILKQITEK